MWSPALKAMARKPSHFGSKSQPFPAGSLSASFASIGSTGGSIGKRAAPLGPLASDRSVLRVLAMAPARRAIMQPCRCKGKLGPERTPPGGTDRGGRDGPRGSSRRGSCRARIPDRRSLGAEGAVARLRRPVDRRTGRKGRFPAYLKGETLVKSRMIQDQPHSSMYQMPYAMYGSGRALLALEPRALAARAGARVSRPDDARRPRRDRAHRAPQVPLHAMPRPEALGRDVRMLHGRRGRLVQRWQVHVRGP